MLNRLLPRVFDNSYRGYKIALWIFGIVVLMRTAISFNSVFHGYMVASSADGIPLDTYSPAAAQTIVSIFAILGLSMFMICLLCILVLIQYRSMIPLMFAILLLQSLLGRFIQFWLPIGRTGTPSGEYITLGILAAIIAGLILSLLPNHRNMQSTTRIK